MVQSIAGGEGSVLSCDNSSPSYWSADSWCCNCNIFPCSTFTPHSSRISRGVGRAAALILVVLHRVWFVSQDRSGAGGRLENCQKSRVWQAVRACWPVGGEQNTTHHQTIPDVCSTNSTSHTLTTQEGVTQTSLSALGSFQAYRVYVMNVLLPELGIPFRLDNELLKCNCCNMMCSW